MFNPFNICKRHNIIIVAEPLGNIAGYYENKVMHINDKLPNCKMEYVVAYLLYGYLHKPHEIFFLMSVSSNQEAKKFAIYLLTQQLEQLEHILNK